MAWLGWIGFVIYGSLLPFEFAPVALERAWATFRNTPLFELGVAERADWIANGVLYLPVGWFTALLFMRTGSAIGLAASLLMALAFCVALAVGVEFAQLFFPPRTVSLNDLWAEVIGSAAGVASARPLMLWRLARRATLPGPLRWDRHLLEVYLVGYLAFCLFPYDLLLTSGELRQKLSSHSWGWFIAPHEAGFVRTVAQLGAEAVFSVPFGFWLAQSTRRRVDGGRAVLAGIGLGLAVEVAQLFIASGTSQGVSVLTRAVAVPLGVTLWRRRDRWDAAVRILQRPGMLALLSAAYLGSVVVANRWPSATWLGWPEARESLRALHFIPFYYHYYTTEALALFSLASVALMYAPPAIFVRLRGGTASTAALLSLSTCAVVELAKLLMQGARPDPSNLVIAAAAGWLAFAGIGILAPGAGASTSVPVSQPGRVSRGAAPIRRRFRLLWLMAVGYALLAALAFPFIPIPLAALLALCAAAVWSRPVLAPAILLAALPVLDLAPWSGRYYWDEFDLLATTCLAMALFRLPAADGEKSDRAFDVAVALLLISFAISTARALWPWQTVDDNAFHGYFSAYNALRIVKGVAWFLPTLLVLRRLGRQGLDIESSILVGMTLGLALSVTVVLWERWLFAGFAAFAGNYRVTGPFSAMHKGGAYVECYLAMAMPFALALALRSRDRIRQAASAGVALGGCFAVMLTFARNGWAALVAAMIVFFALLLRHAQTNRRQVALAAVIGGAAVVLSVPVLLGSFAQQRLAGTAADLELRRAHWSDALAARDSGVATALFGMGVGRFPQTHHARSLETQKAATYAIATEAGNRHLRLGSGSPLYVEQIVPVRHGGLYLLSLRLRSAQAPTALTVSLCEKWMLTSARCSSARFSVPTAGAWHTVQTPIGLEATDAALPERLRPVKLSLQAPAEGAVIDVDDVRLEAPGDSQVVANAGFESRLDRWFFTVDVNPPWNIDSLPVAVLFDQGWFGVVAWAALLVVVLMRGVAQARSGNLARIAAVAALTAFVVSGVLNTLIDAPRLLWLVLIVGWVSASADRRRSVPESRS